MGGYRKPLLDSLNERKAGIGIIGMGYVGFPMAHLAASKGFHVVGIEVDPDRVEAINRGESYIQDVSSEDVAPLVKSGKLEATTDYAAIRDLEVVMITVPTPLGKTGDPDLSFVINALESMRPFMPAW